MPLDSDEISRLLEDHDSDRQTRERAHIQRKQRQDAFMGLFQDRLANIIMPALEQVACRSLPDYITFKARKGDYEGELSISINPPSYASSPLPEVKRIKFSADPGKTRVSVYSETENSSSTYVEVEDITRERVEDELRKFLSAALKPKH